MARSITPNRLDIIGCTSFFFSKPVLVPENVLILLYDSWNSLWIGKTISVPQKLKNPTGKVFLSRVPFLFFHFILKSSK
jgi:hypothetical protein